MNQPVQKKWASAYFNGDFYAIVSNSGYRSSALDPEVFEAYLLPRATDEELGHAVLSAIEKSRFLKLDEIDEFFDPKRISLKYSTWVNSMIGRYQYKTKRALFADMLLCNIVMNAGKIEIAPTSHEKLEAWNGLEELGVENVDVAVENLPVKVGQALRGVFGRCQ